MRESYHDDELNRAARLRRRSAMLLRVIDLQPPVRWAIAGYVRASWWQLAATGYVATGPPLPVGGAGSVDAALTGGFVLAEARRAALIGGASELTAEPRPRG